MAYYLLTGRAPFEADKAIKVMIAHVREPVVPPSQYRLEIPADLEQVVLRCLAKSPADRYPDVTLLEEALAQCEAAERWNRQQAAQWWQENQRLVSVAD